MEVDVTRTARLSCFILSILSFALPLAMSFVIPFLVRASAVSWSESAVVVDFHETSVADFRLFSFLMSLSKRVRVLDTADAGRLGYAISQVEDTATFESECMLSKDILQVQLLRFGM